MALAPPDSRVTQNGTDARVTQAGVPRDTEGWLSWKIDQVEKVYVNRTTPVQRIYAREEVVWPDYGNYQDTIARSMPARWWRLNDDDAVTTLTDWGTDPLTLTREGTGTLGLLPIVNGVGTSYSTGDAEGRWASGTQDFSAYNNKVTIECWVEIDSDAPIIRIMGNYQAGALGVLQLELNANTMRAYIARGGGAVTAAWNFVGDGFDARDGRKLHLVGTRETVGTTTTVQLFVNGVQRAVNTWEGTPTNNTTCNFRVGGYGASGANPLIGKIDQAAMYQRVLGADEVLAHYNSGMYGS